MELGNLVFGHARGSFEIDRDAWSDLFAPLFEAMGIGGRLTHFENDTFAMRPYDWSAECDCGQEEAADAWHKDNPHTPECFSTRLMERYFEEWRGMDHDAKSERLREFLAAEGVPHDGCMRRCDCGQTERSEAYYAEHDHAESCRLEIPNFLHKPTGYRINVYKWAFRDSYANLDLTPDQVRAVVADCLASLQKDDTHV